VRFEDLATGPAPQLGLEVFQRRRKRLARLLGEGHALVVATHPTHQYSHDVDYLFRPHSDFWYLTGFAEPRALLVLHGGSGRTEVFVQPRKKEAEIWTGRRLGNERAADVLGIDRAFAIEEAADELPALLRKAKVHAVSDHDPAMRRRIARIAGRRLVAETPVRRPGGPEAKPSPKRLFPHGRELLHDMRLVKEPEELRMLRKACDLGVEAHLQAAGRIAPGAHEFEVEADFAHHARRRGSTGVGYPSICGCGPNAAVLHYVTNQDRLRKGDLFLIDAGCEWGYYTSDITRTYPVGGAFTTRQAELYDLVLRAHDAAMRKVRPGNRFRDPHEAAVQVIADGLCDLGLLDMDPEQAVKEQAYRRFFMHGTSHWLGLDVHDAGTSTGPDGKPRVLQEGMVLTVEPGLYFNRDFTECPPGTAGIGIRVEDDVAVTDAGHRNLTKALPTAPDAVAALAGRA
jgi:Xaa-Pro aminopeptidase